MKTAQALGHEATDCGAYSAEQTDYPIWGSAAAKAVVSGRADRGVVICGTGIGIGISANKIRGIRCAICSEPYSAELSRRHNNTNMLAMGSRVVGPELAKMIMRVWLETEFEGGRHQRRIDEMTELEERQTIERKEEGL